MRHLFTVNIPVLPEDANLGRRLWVSWALLLLQVTVGSDREWPMLIETCGWGFEREGTFTSGCEGSGWEEGGSRSSSEEPPVTPSGLDSDLGMWRPLARVTESGRGKVPMPLSRVLIWQPKPKVTGRGVWRLGEAGDNDTGKEKEDLDLHAAERVVFKQGICSRFKTQCKWKKRENKTF